MQSNRNSDLDKLKQRKKRDEYKIVICGKYNVLGDKENMDEEGEQRKMKEAVTQATEEVLGYRKNAHKPWVSQQSRIRSEEQRKLTVENGNGKKGKYFISAITKKFFHSNINHN